MVVGSLFVVAGCSGHTSRHTAPRPSAAEVARTLLAAYQANNALALREFTAGTLRLAPGELGRVTHVHWRTPITEGQTYPGFAPGAVYVPFDASTTGSPDHTIPLQKHWTWGFVMARMSPSSGWLAVDDGVG